MDEFQAKVQADKEAKRKRLLELQAAKKMREDEQKKKEDTSKRSFPRPGDTPVDELISRVLSAAPRTSVESPMTPAAGATSPVKPQHRTTLSMQTNATTVNPRPKAMTYEREIQVDVTAMKNDEDDVDEGVQPEPTPSKQKGVRKAPQHSKSDVFASPFKPAEEVRAETEHINTDMVMASAEFNEFFSKSTRLVERALGQNFDVCSIFRGDSSPRSSVSLLSIEPVLKFIDPSVSDRCVGVLQWSPAHEELLLASYALAGREALADPQGTVKIWSLSLRHRPEFSLYCQSTVTSAVFNQFDHNMIIGGVYSGRLVIWDLRAKSAPVQRTPMIAEAHSQPISTLQLTGSQNANNIVSLSTDGKICVWSTNMLNAPTSSLEVKQKTKDVACLALAFPDNETNAFYVGMEDGSIVYSQLLASKVVDSSVEMLEAHTGPVTALDLHKVGDNLYSEGAGNLMLSSSVDWTIKLWNPKISRNPLISFENYADYVYDVKWSPVNPSLFAACDGDGNLDIWDLSASTESPTIRESASTHAINRIGWSSHGLRLACGTSKGQVAVYQVSGEHAQTSPTAWTQLEQLLSV